MAVNKVTIERTQGTDKLINIPIELSWDYDGIDQVLTYMKKMLLLR